METSFIFEIIGYLGISTATVAALSRWLGGVWAKRIIRVEQAKLDSQLEILKSSLLEKTKLTEIRLNAVNQERFTALKENYELLAEVWLDCRWAIQPDEIGRDKPPEYERLEKAAQSLDIYFRDFERKKIFLSKKSQNAIYDFIHKVWKSLDNLRIFSTSTEPYKKRIDALYSEWIHELSPKMNEARKSIEDEYKDLIGIEDHNKALQRTSHRMHG